MIFSALSGAKSRPYCRMPKRSHNCRQNSTPRFFSASGPRSRQASGLSSPLEHFLQLILRELYRHRAAPRPLPRQVFCLRQNLEIGRIHFGRFAFNSGAPAAAGHPASQARLNIFSSSYFVSFTATGRLRGLCRVKCFALGKTLKSAEFTSDDLRSIPGPPQPPGIRPLRPA